MKPPYPSRRFHALPPVGRGVVCRSCACYTTNRPTWRNHCFTIVGSVIKIVGFSGPIVNDSSREPRMPAAGGAHGPSRSRVTLVGVENNNWEDRGQRNVRTLMGILGGEFNTLWLLYFTERPFDVRSNQRLQRVGTPAGSSTMRRSRCATAVQVGSSRLARSSPINTGRRFVRGQTRSVRSKRGLKRQLLLNSVSKA